jgi:hypothetical protein
VIILTREEAQQILDALQCATPPTFSTKLVEDWQSAVETLRARLAQPEPEPVACIVKDCENHKHQGRFVGDLCSPCHAFITRNEGKYSQAYRNAQREWQGLTDEEMQVTVDEIAIDAGDSIMYPMGSFARAIEAKLKEKNSV